MASSLSLRISSAISSVELPPLLLPVSSCHSADAGTLQAVGYGEVYVEANILWQPVGKDALCNLCNDFSVWGEVALLCSGAQAVTNSRYVLHAGFEYGPNGAAIVKAD